ncbi:MAG: hypothetical protein ACOYMA_03975 [Bacteroidia bacterium]
MSLLLLIVFSLLSAANAQSIIGSNPKLLPSDQVNSDQFKSKAGQNRVQEFKLLNDLIKTVPLINEPAPNYEYFIGDYTTSLAELIFLLGEPDVKVSSTIYQYNLGVSSSNSKAYIGINNEGFVTYSVINLNN